MNKDSANTYCGIRGGGRPPITLGADDPGLAGTDGAARPGGPPRVDGAVGAARLILAGGAGDEERLQIQSNREMSI